MFRGNVTAFNYFESGEATVTGSVGVALNLLIVVITVHPTAINDKHVDNRFKWFIGNLALADLFYSLYIAFLAPFMALNFFHIDFYIPLCTLIHYWAYVSSACAVTCLPLLAINRYVSLCRSAELYERVYTSGRIALLCLLGYLPALVMLPTFFSELQFNRKCGFWYKCGTCQRINSFLPFAGVVIFTVCTYKVFGRLHKHQDIVQSLNDTERYRANQTLLRCLIAQGVVPIVCTVPAMALIMMHAFVSTPPAINLVMAYLLRLNPIFDALGTLIIVKPYKRAALAFVKGLCVGTVRVAPEPMTAAQQATVRGANKSTPAVEIG